MVEDVISRAKSGDQEAWRQLYRLHASRVLALLQLLPNNDSSLSADDIAAHAWLTAADKLHTFSGDETAFGGWLYAIARNHNSRTSKRSTHAATPRPAGDAADLDVVGGGSTFDLSELERLDSIRHLLDLLPERQRAVVACLDVVGLDVPATAQALGMTQTAVRVNRHRGLARLRSHLTAVSPDPRETPAPAQ
jgi:RNA polymerase sigma-70 factor (ECF subfamily)